MAYLHGYEHDAFISYAHGPKFNLFNSDDDGDLLSQWSRTLVQDLGEQVAVKLGTKEPDRTLSLWMDPNLRGNEPLSDTLKKAIEGSALLVVIMSPYYLASSWCGKEVEWFAAVPGYLQRRIFVVHAWWTDRMKWPLALKDHDGESGLGYSFVPREEEGADPFGYPCSSEKERKYLDAVARLAKDIAKEIKAIDQRNASVQVTAPNRSVFLGYMSETLQESREELRTCLAGQDIAVVPPVGEDPVDEASLGEALATYALRSSAVVLIANEYPGLWPRNHPGGFVGYQLQRAHELAVPCHLWLQVEDVTRVKKPEYRQFLEDLSTQARSANVALHYADAKAFAADIRSRLDAAAPQAGTGVEQLAVICSNLPEDKSRGQVFRDAIQTALRDTRREIFTFDFANTKEPVKLRKVGERVRDADTVLVLCFDQEWDWARMLIKEISGLSELRAGCRTKILVAGPADKNGGLYDASVFGFKTLDGMDGSTERLQQLLKHEFDLAVPPSSAAARH